MKKSRKKGIFKTDLLVTLTKEISQFLWNMGQKDRKAEREREMQKTNKEMKERNLNL